MKIKKISRLIGVRSVRLSALAVIIATFVGLPAFGRAIGTATFEKLDAVNYLSSVLLAQEFGGEIQLETIHTDTQNDTSSDCLSTGECSFDYSSIGSKYALPVGAQITEQKSQLYTQLNQNTDLAKDWTDFSSRADLLIDKLTESTTKIASQGESNKTLTKMLLSVSGMDLDIKENIDQINKHLSSLKTVVSRLSSTSTAGDVAGLKVAIQMLQTFNTLGQAMEVRVEASEQSVALADIYLQIANLKYQDALPNDLQKEINLVQNQADKLAGYIAKAEEQYTNIFSEISDIRAETDPTKVSKALASIYLLGKDLSVFSDEMLSEFNDFWASNPKDL